MGNLFLLIPDAALREAVMEQITAAKLAAPHIADASLGWLKQAAGENPCVIVMDEAACDKKMMSALQGFGDKQPKPALLLLGGKEESEHATETFAKPLRLGHLMTRIRYYLETAPLLQDRAASFGPYRLEPHNRCLIVGKTGETIRLTEKETALLTFLAHSAQPATRRDILAEVWGYDERIDTHTLETHIYQLRRKLDGGGSNWLIFEAGAYRLAREQE